MKKPLHHQFIWFSSSTGKLEFIDIELRLIGKYRYAQTLANNIPGAWYPCQHLNNPHNPDAHEIYTAREIESAHKGHPYRLIVCCNINPKSKIS